jgi:hypothetical protein
MDDPFRPTGELGGAAPDQVRRGYRPGERLHVLRAHARFDEPSAARCVLRFGGLSYRPPRVRPPRACRRVAFRGAGPVARPGFRAPGTRRAELRRPARAPSRRRAGQFCRRACRPRFRHGRGSLLACDDPGVWSIATGDGSREGLRRRASARGADASCARCRKSPSRTTYRRGCASGRRTPGDTLRSNRPLSDPRCRLRARPASRTGSARESHRPLQPPW